MPCLLKEIKDKVYLTEVLVPFTQQNKLKVGIDTKNKIVNKYAEIAQNNPGIASWLHLMSYEPTSFERINTPDNKLSADLVEFYLNVCKHVAQQKKVIVYSHQTLSDYTFIDENVIEYDGCSVNVYDRDDAIKELKGFENNILIKDSIVANDGSTIKNVKK